MSRHKIIILGIETSCDETAAAVLEGHEQYVTTLSNVVSSQVKLHAPYGGVVPNLAAREHVNNILPVVEAALAQANKKSSDIDLIAVTRSPGLIPALLIGTSTAKTLSWLWNKPVMGIHHIEGHIYANFIMEKEETTPDETVPLFPILTLVVSGGHTQLILMKNHFEYTIVGETLDDAAGEAFDKVARILGLGYPGGPEIAAAAEDCQNTEHPITLPRPLLQSSNLNFSFSGLKTAVLYRAKEFRKQQDLSDDAPLPKKFVQSVAQEFQQAVVDVLTKKTMRAIALYKPKTVMLAGGVSANTLLRKSLQSQIQNLSTDITYKTPGKGYSIDNAAMIASAAYFRWTKMNSHERTRAKNDWKNLQASAQEKM